MSDEQRLFTVLHGSRLYGTDGPDSDHDYKCVVLPPLDYLLLNRQLKNRQVKTEDVEMEVIPLQVFLNDFFNGQTYALEMAMVVRHEGCLGSPWVSDWVKEMGTRFLTRDVKKMMGYAVAQSRTYGLKAERYGHLKKACDIVQRAVDCAALDITQKRLADVPWLVEKVREVGCIRDTEIPNAGDGTELAPAVEVYGKKFPLTATVQSFKAALERSLALYGERARGYETQAVDLKALSHAIRIIEQIRELCAMGDIVFPRRNAQFLKDVKYGVIPTNDALAYLAKVFDGIEDVIEKSILQARTPELTEEFKDFSLRVLRDAYKLQAIHSAQGTDWASGPNPIPQPQSGPA